MELGPLVALGPQTGESNWSHEAASGSGVSGSPALADGRLYVGDLDGTFHALDAVRGDVLWSVEEYGKWFSGPVVTGDSVSEHCVFTVDGDGSLVSFDADGTERWQENLDPPVRTSPVVAGDHIYLGTSDGLPCALS